MEFSFGIEAGEMDRMLENVLEMGLTSGHCTSGTLCLCTGAAAAC